MTSIITTDDKSSFEQIANEYKHLIDEGEALTIKNCYGKRVYYKVEGKMQLKPK